MKSTNLISVVTLLLGICFNSSILGQQIKGRVIDAQKAPIIYANIVLQDSETGVFIKGEVTDDNGIFNFEGIEPNVYQLKMSMIGYNELLQVVELKDENVYNEYTLILDENRLDEVTIEGKRPLYVRKLDRTVVNVQNTVTSAGGNALEILERSPGISVDRLSNTISLMGRNGVIVMINGKRTRLEASSLIQMLQSTSAANIDNIELITNPPASFDAEGAAGIINIIMVENEQKGFNGNAILNMGYGKRGKYGGNISANYNNKNYNIYANVNSNHNYSFSNELFYQNVFYESEKLEVNSPTDRLSYRGRDSGKLGIDLDITDKLTWSGFVSGSLGPRTLDADAAIEYVLPFDGVTSEHLSSSERNTMDHYMLSNRLEYALSEKNKISIDYDYLYYDRINPTSYNLSQRINQMDSESMFSSSSISEIRFNVAKADWTNSINENLKLSIGTKVALAEVENNTFLLYEKPTSYIDETFTSGIQRKENTYAGYFSFEGSLGNDISYSAGLRYELNDLVIQSNKEGVLVDRKNGQLFPVMNVSKTIDKNTYSFSYNRRIPRPGFFALAPAFYYLDTRTLRSGNINILSTISNTYSASAQISTVSFSLRYSNLDNPIYWNQPFFDEESNQLILRPVNFLDVNSIAANLTFPLKLSKKWSSRFNFNGMYRWEKSLVESELTKTNSIFINGNFSTNYDLGKSWEAELSGRWNLANTYGFIKYKPRISANLGISKKFANKSKLTLNWSDLFNTGSFRSLYSAEGQYGRDSDYEGNVVNLTYSFSFGNTKAKKAGRTDTGSQDIQNRAR